MTHFLGSSFEFERVKASGVTRCHRRVYPASALVTDLGFMVHKRVILEPDQEPSVFLPSVTLSRTVGTARLCLKRLPRARARATERSNVLFNLWTDLRGPSKTSWSNNLALLAWLVEHCSKLLLLCHRCEPHDGHTAYMRFKGKSWIV